MGTLDSLMTMTDELGRADATVEVQVYKLIDSIRQLLDASVGAGASATGKKSGAAATTMEALSAQLTVGDRMVTEL